MENTASSARQFRHAALLIPLAFVLGGCQHMRPPHGEAPNGAQLAAQFVKPVNGKVALVVGVDGELTVVDSEGNIVPACKLPGVTEFAGKKVMQADVDLPTCRGTVGTTIEKVTPVSITHHTGSDCITFTFVRSGHVQSSTYCY
ncbi:MAG: hypothetical protein KDI66_20865 [Xanthomonadales bacterium]|nr:hypothetical protein [Xanthomonadales bacterium]